MIFEDKLEEFLLDSDIFLLEESVFPDKFFVEFDTMLTTAFIGRRTLHVRVTQKKFLWYALG